MNPLDQLRDLHLPREPGLWPPAPGWWLLLALLVALVIAAIWLWRRYRANNRYRREALGELDRIAVAGNTLPTTLNLIRRVAITAQPQTSWAALSAVEILERLDSQSQNRLQNAFGEQWQQLDSLLYGAGAELPESQKAALIAATRKWIRRHRRAALC